jgi:hypothetical protein
MTREGGARIQGQLFWSRFDPGPQKERFICDTNKTLASPPNVFWSGSEKHFFFFRRQDHGDYNFIRKEKERSQGHENSCSKNDDGTDRPASFFPKENIFFFVCAKNGNLTVIGSCANIYRCRAVRWTKNSHHGSNRGAPALPLVPPDKKTRPHKRLQE